VFGKPSQTLLRPSVGEEEGAARDFHKQPDGLQTHGRGPRTGERNSVSYIIKVIIY